MFSTSYILDVPLTYSNSKIVRVILFPLEKGDKMRKKTILSILLLAIFTTTIFGAFASLSAEFPWTTNLGDEGLGTSQWVISNAYTGFYSVEMNSTGATVGDEGRFVVTLASGIPLDSLYTISWQVFTALGYPPHVDVILSSGNVLTAEMAVDQGMSIIHIASILPKVWVKTFELFPGDTGHDEIDNSTVFWVANLGGGTSDAPFGTLQNWKDNSGLSNPGNDTIPDVSSDTIVRLEFEVDNWIANSESYIDDILINGLDIMGVSGPKGDTGATGPKGDRGSRGLTGIQGLTGLQGEQGETGLAGEAGSDGLQGPKGDAGLLGPQGIAGETGSLGATGDAGPQGVAGEAGSQGPKGEQGDTGAVGPKGAEGEPAPVSIAYGGAALGTASLLGLLYMFFRAKP